MTRQECADLAYQNYLAAVSEYTSACGELSRAVLARIAANHEAAMAQCAEHAATDRLLAANADKKRLLQSFSRAAAAAEGARHRLALSHARTGALNPEFKHV